MKIPSHIINKLKNLGVTTLFLFGSRALGIAHKNSDYDFGVLLENSGVLGQGTQKLYQKIYELLEEVVKKRVTIDIVFLDHAPLQLRFHVMRFGEVLLDFNPQKRALFIEKTMLEHADFEPYRRLFEETTLARIP